MRLDQFQKTLLMAVVLVAIVAILDYLQYPAAFYGYTFVLGAILAIAYYLFKKDKSESLAVFIGYVILIIGGLWDWIFYVYKGLFGIEGGIPEAMPHLYSHKIIGIPAKLMGHDTVTMVTLTISAGLSLVASYYITKYLRKKW